MNDFIAVIRRNFRENRLYLLVFLLIWIVVCLFSLSNYKDSLGKKAYGNNRYDAVEVLSSKKDVKQTITVKEDVDTVAVRFEVYKKNNSLVNLKVEGKQSGTLYAEKTFKVRDILTASFNVVGFNEKADINKDREIVVHITTDDDNDAIGVWCSQENVLDNTLYVSDKIAKGSLSMRLLYEDDMYAAFNRIIICLLVISVSLLILFTGLFDLKKELIFTAMIIIFGLFIMMIITPLSGPDEEYHYHRSLVFSNKMMHKEPYQIEDVYVNSYHFNTDYSDGEEYETILNNLDKPLEDLNTRPITEIEKDHVYWYDLCYTPYSLGITVARLLRLNGLVTYYMGGLFGLIFYALCMYFAIRETPVLKTMLGITAALPICLQQATIYSSDLIIIAFCFLLFAYLMKWYTQKEKISVKDLIIVFVINVLLAPDKAIYSLLTILFWFINEEKYQSRKHRLIFMCLLMAPIIYQFGEQFLTRFPIFNTIFADDGETDVDVRAKVIKNLFSIEYALAHPLEAIKMFFRTIRYEFKDWIVGSFGRYLSNLNLILPSFMAYVYLVLLLLSSLLKQDVIADWRLKIASLFISVVIVMITLAYMLVGWTDIEDPYIQGIQGRYFTPLIPFVLLTLNSEKFSLPRKLDKILIYGQILISFEVILYALSYTFVY